MSSSRTTNLNLHAWNADDPVRRDEFNENFAAIDAAIAANTAAIAAAGGVRMIAGTYTGDGNASQFIDLGVTPKAVFLLRYGHYLQSSSVFYGGLAVAEYPNTFAISIVSGGFSVKSNGDSRTNQINEPYCYIARY